jgi:hypothetical protein
LREAETGEMVLDHEHAVKAQRFGLEHVVDVALVADAVAFGAATRRARAAEQSEAHGASVKGTRGGA